MAEDARPPRPGIEHAATVSASPAADAALAATGAAPGAPGPLAADHAALAETAAASAAGAASASQRAGQAPMAVGALVAERYVVERLLGEGTFGWVFLARSRAEPGGRVALKVLRPEHAQQDDLVVRFKRRELELLRRVHAGGRVPNVVAPVEADVVSHDGSPVLVLEYVDGPTLTEVIAKERMLDQTDARAIAGGVARGLAALHAAGGVHRDLKPDNIRLRDDGEPVILDLGIAKAMWDTQKLTGTGQYLMTPFYAAPEQLVGGEVGPHSDVYALGLILYEMLVGTVPLAGRSYAETLTARTLRDPPDPRASGRVIAPGLAGQTLQCLDRDPTRRPSAAALAAALAAPPAAPARRGSRRAIVLAVTATVIGLGGAAGLFAARHRAPPAVAPSGMATAPRERALPASVPAPASVPVPAPLAVAIEMPTTRLKAGEAIRLRLTGTRRAHVLLVAVDEAGAGVVLLPSKLHPAPVVAPDAPVDFPGRGPKVIARLPKGARATTERLVVVAAERAEALGGLVPPGAARTEMLALSAAQVASLDRAAAARGADVARSHVTYEIVAAAR